MAEAREKEPNDSNAMSLATVDEHGRPDVRVVLLKDISEKGFAFYTNFDSAKGQQLSANPVA
ncbi:MAG: pyridoxamine 5'-phosphate oxidase family protein, partial [Henriciella sp.]